MKQNNFIKTLYAIAEYADRHWHELIASVVFTSIWHAILDFSLHFIGVVFTMISSYIIFSRFKNWAHKKTWWDKYFKH
jgi:hypothetical protein